MIRVLLSVSHNRYVEGALESCLCQGSEAVSVDLFIQRFNPFPGGSPYENLEIKNDTARRIALEGEYDYLLNVEDDIILPGHAVDLLIDADRALVSGLYRLRAEHSGDNHLAARIYDPDVNGGSDDRYLVKKDIQFFGDIIECTMTGIGCILIRSDLLKELGGCMGHDVKICRRAYELCVIPAVHTGVCCIHVNGNNERIEV